MINLFRIVEHQASLSSYRATQNEELAVQLELLIEMTKPKTFYTEWHPLIATPFRYNPPHPHARFRPPYGKNIFYGSFMDDTTLYEHAFHFIQQRIHLKIKTETGTRTLFSAEANNNTVLDITNEDNITELMNKNDYSASHQFIETHPKATFIIYPSCRDPQQRMNAAILDINVISKNIASETSINFFYDNKKKQMLWIDRQLAIKWDEVR